MPKKKEFSILKWIVFPANSVILAGIIAWFNLTVFGFDDGLPYCLIVGMIGVFSIIINRYTESENRSLAVAAFVFEIFLTAALVINAAYSISVQRKMSVARMGETNQAQTIEQISKLRGSRTQREALKKVGAQESSQTVFGQDENVLFWIMVGELALYAVSAFTLFALAKLVDKPAVLVEDPFPHELDVNIKTAPKESRFLRTQKSDSGRLSPVSAHSFDRKEALKKLREHLRDVSFYCPGKWFKADLMAGGVTIRMFEKQKGVEQTIARTDQSDKLLAAVDRPDFHERLVEELHRQTFPIERAGKEGRL